MLAYNCITILKALIKIGGNAAGRFENYRNGAVSNQLTTIEGRGRVCWGEQWICWWYRMWQKRFCNQRPYLINFDATGSPCHELTSWDNSSSMSIWLGRKESHCEDILPVSSTDGARETERGGPCRPIETEVIRDSKNTYDRVSFLDYIPP